MKVLYLHPAGPFGGASKSLLDAVSGLVNVTPMLVCPRGETAGRARHQGIDTIETVGLSQIDNTSFGGYRGARKLILLRELALAPISAWALLRARLRWGPVDIVHVNEVTLTLLLPLIRRLYRAPIVVHVRSTQEQAWTTFKSKLIGRILSRHAARLIAIDETVKATLPATWPTTVIHNGFSIPPHASIRPISPASSPLVVTYVGGLMAAKGIFDLVEAARICRDRGLDVHWRIFGDNVRTVRGVRAAALSLLGAGADVRSEVESLITKHSLAGVVTLEGHHSDYELIYAGSDVVLCITHANAAGRPVFEGGFFGRPSIVAISDPRPDTVVDNVTALCIPARQPQALADAVARLCANRALVESMGQAARQLALEYFDIERCSSCLQSLYEELCGVADARAPHVTDHPV